MQVKNKEKKTHKQKIIYYEIDIRSKNETKKLNKNKNKQKTNYVIIKRLEGIHILNQLINLNKMSYYKQKTKPNVLLNGVYVDRNGNLFLDSYVCL